MGNERPYSISGAVLFYGMACTLIVAIGLAAMMMWMNRSLLQDLANMQADNRAAWEDVQEARMHTAASNSTLAACRLELVRYEAKMELVDKLVLATQAARGTGGR